MEYLLVALFVWFAWNLLLQFFTTPGWFPPVFVVVLSVGGSALVEPANWWWGLGLAGLAAAFMLVGDLLLVTTDWMKAKLLSRR